MKNESVRQFIRHGRRSEPMLWDDEIALCPREYYGYSKQIGCECSLIFDIVRRRDANIAGEIALRIGDSPEQFYLGHIGYHVDPPFRGRGFAARACKLCEPLLVSIGQRDIVITTDPDNLPSVKTCEKLGCELECTVPVPPSFQQRLEISAEKHRFVWTLNPCAADASKR